MNILFPTTSPTSLIVILVCLNGCVQRENLYPVHGRVEFEDGTPVKSGTVEFRLPERQKVARGKISADGMFSLSTFALEDGALAGKHQVIVAQTILYNSADQHQHAKGLRLVHPVYASYDTTPLEVVVHADRPNNRVNIVVSKTPPD